MSRWGPEGPPQEAYSRVTDAERFRPLHVATEALLVELCVLFEVERVDGHDLDEEQALRGVARPSTRLVPRDAGAAPLVVTFTTFPGVRVRAGHWCTDAFPTCGCDACDETADGEAARLRRMVDAVVAGRFREEVSVPLIGDGWQSWQLWWVDGRRASGRSRIGRRRARAMLAAAGHRSIAWAPWPSAKRQHGATTGTSAPGPR